MKKPVSLILLIFILSYFTSSSLPVLNPMHLFRSGYGPEDMVADTLSTPPRLLVSCSSRRPDYPAYGEIEAINPASKVRVVMTRTGEPQGLVFRPHGISLVQAGEIQYLYVILHDDVKKAHPVIQYQVDADTLIFIRRLDSKLLISPNALQAYPDGSLLVCNDAGKHNSMKEKIFRQKKGNILFFDGRANWTIAADTLGMPAGLAALGKRVFVSAALENKLYSYDLSDGKLTGKKIVSEIKGPDNIRVYEGNLIVTSHSKPLKFISHTRKVSHKSPSLVLSVDVRSGKTTRLFYDNGNQISAASVAMFLNNQLIIGQIFEPFVGIIDFDR